MQNYITSNFTFANIIPDKALGSQVWDIEGKNYIDLAGGIAVNALGHCHPQLISALNKQAQKLWHISNLYTTKTTQQMAENFIKNTFANKVFFANSGAEANEAALKLARKYAYDHFGSQKNEIIACINSFHGRTLFTVSVGGQEKYQQGFGPLPLGITHIPFNDVDALKTAINPNTCAVIIEPIQGESGVLPAEHIFLQTARQECSKHQVALIFDEVQTGIGRTGHLFAYQYYGVTPDILTSAKALGNGFPISAMLTNKQFASAFTPGSHGTTFGGNPLACAVANTAFDIINTTDTFNHINQQSHKLQELLTHLAKETGVFKTIRGVGLLIGAVLHDDYHNRAHELVQIALQHQVMVLQAGANVIRFAPSLIINNEDLTEGIQRFKSAVQTWIQL